MSPHPWPCNCNKLSARVAQKQLAGAETRLLAGANCVLPNQTNWAKATWMATMMLPGWNKGATADPCRAMR
eukprot:11224665-Lingulodinium_polyedra.AAC.1